MGYGGGGHDTIPFRSNCSCVRVRTCVFACVTVCVRECVNQASSSPPLPQSHGRARAPTRAHEPARSCIACRIKAIRTWRCTPPVPSHTRTHTRAHTHIASTSRPHAPCASRAHSQSNSHTQAHTNNTKRPPRGTFLFGKFAFLA